MDGNSSTVGNNISGRTYVGWQWLAGNSTGSSNSNGSITSTVSVNQTAGFSIVSWTGSGANATIGHGQSAAPEFIMVKNGDTTNAWTVQSLFLTSADYVLYLNTSAGEGSDASAWNSAFAGATTISIGTDPGTNGSTNNMAFWAWRSIEGYSSFGSYTGNGSGSYAVDYDGPFIYTGFKPAFVLIKRIDSTGNWVIFDDKRSPINPRALQLHPDLPNVDGAGNDQDFLANGWKVRSNGSAANATGGTYIYAAFAENPFGGSGVAQAKAV